MLRINCTVLHGLHSVLMTSGQVGNFALNGTANDMKDSLAPKSPSLSSTTVTQDINTGKRMKRLRAHLRRRTSPMKNRLRELGLFSQEKRRLLGKPQSNFPVLKVGLRRVGRDPLAEPVVTR